jgi:hypothetical protein
MRQLFASIAVDPVVADTDALKQIEKRLAANKEHLKKYYGTVEQVRQAASDQTVLIKVKSSYATGTTKEAEGPESIRVSASPAG